jgi:predicted GNAT family N-acyltransferase
MSDRLEIRVVAAEDVRPIRRRILRAHRPDDDAAFDGDDDPDAFHVAAFVDGRLVAAASALRRPPPGSSDDAAWRIRGMATDPAERGRGIAGALLDRCLEYVDERDGGVVWCNARLDAIALYERHGFVRETEPFEVEGIGPHVRMRRSLPRAAGR